MFKRPVSWFGLLLRALTALGVWRPRPVLRPAGLDPLFDLVSDAVLTCNASGAVTGANAAAQQLFGPSGVGLARLRYSNDQPVPPGQSPLTRALRTGTATESASYLLPPIKGKARALEIKAGPLPNGAGAVLTARDRTEVSEGRAREAKTHKRSEILRALCRRLSAALSADETAQTTVESALALLDGLPDARARLYSYDSDAKRLTRLASAPDDRPKRPKSQRQSQPLAFPFDASSPLLWSVYVAREPATGDDLEGPAYAVPLLLGGVAVGHLSVTCPEAPPDADTREALGQLASLVALAQSGPRQGAQATSLVAQVESLQGVVKALTEQIAADMLADLIGGEVRRLTGAEVCTLALKDGDHLRLAGTAYRDALLFPDRHAANDAKLIGDATREAVKKSKTVQRLGRANPAFEAGVWRAFAGQSGRHSIASVPLTAGQGALTVYAAGDAPFPVAQVKFLETLAALASLPLLQATPPAGRTEP